MENTKETVIEFEERLSAKVKRQENLEIVEKRNFRKGKLLGKYKPSIRVNTKELRKLRI